MRAVGMLIGEVQNCERFTAEQEAQLYLLMRTGDIEARDRLFMSCVPWAIRQAGIFYRNAMHRGNTRSNIDDMTQEALWGLLESLRIFNPAKGRLTTIAHHYIYRRLIWYSKTNNIIHIPVDRCGKKDEFNPATLPITSLEALPVLNSIEDDDTSTAIKRYDDDELINKHIADLPERWRKILYMRFWEGRTLQDIGNIIGLTRERIRQIEAKAIKRLQSTIRNSGVIA